MKIKKVCILQNGLARGGTDTFVVNLCKGLDKEKFDIILVNPSNKPGSMVREQDVLSSGCRILRTSPLNIGIISRIKHFKRLYCILRKEQIDVFQSNIDLFNGPNMLVSWLARVPIRVCHSHNSLQNKELVEGRTLAVRIYQFIMRWMCWSFSNRRTGCSPEAMDFLFKGHDWRNDSNSTVVYNGIDVERFRQTIDISNKRSELGLSAKYNVLTVGRMIAQKNPFFIIDVFSELRNKRDDVNFVWVGTGSMENEVKKYIEEKKLSSCMQLLGERNDIPDIMKCCDAFLMPSIFEGLGIVLIEAQAAGMTCLVSNEIPELANCGACKKMSLLSTSKEWSAALEDIIEKRLSLIVDNERLNNFSIENMINQMTKVFNS